MLRPDFKANSHEGVHDVGNGLCFEVWYVSGDVKFDIARHHGVMAIGKGWYWTEVPPVGLARSFVEMFPDSKGVFFTSEEAYINAMRVLKDAETINASLQQNMQTLMGKYPT
jgi:hypothetical protein